LIPNRYVQHFIRSPFEASRGLAVSASAVAIDHRHLYCAGLDSTIRVFSLGDFSPKMAFSTTSPTSKSCLATLGSRLFVGSTDGALRVFDTFSLEPAPLRVVPIGAKIVSMAVAPDDSYVAVGCADGSVHLFWPESLEKVASVALGDTSTGHEVIALAFLGRDQVSVCGVFGLRDHNSHHERLC
jgi:WD40 repeat protein